MAEDTDVGDLVVTLTGDLEPLSQAIEESQDLFDGLEESAAMASSNVEGMAATSANAMRRTYSSLADVSQTIRNNDLRQFRLWREAMGRESGMSMEGFFGGYRSPGMQLIRHSGMLLGMSGIGGQVRFLSHMVHGLGFGMGTAVVGAFLLGEAIKGILEKQEKLVEKQKEWHNKLIEMREEWQRTAQSILYTDETSRMLLGDITKMEGEARKTGKEIEDNLKHFHRPFVGMMERFQFVLESAARGGPEETTIYNTNKLLQDQIDLYNAIRKSREDMWQQYRTTQREGVQKTLDFDLQGAAIASMADSAKKKRMEANLENAKARQAFEQEAIQQRIRLSALSHSDILAAQGVAEKMKAAKQSLDDSAELEATLAAKRVVMEEKNAYRLLALERQLLNGRKDEYEAMIDAEVTLEMTGYARKMELLRRHNQRKLDEYGGENKGVLRLTQKYEMAAEARDRTEGLSDTLQQLQDRLDAALHPASRWTAEWNSMVKQLNLSWAVTAQELDVIRAKFQQVMEAEKASSFRQAMQGFRDTLAGLDGPVARAMEQWKEMARKFREELGLTEEQIGRLRVAFDYVTRREIRASYRGEFEKLHPMLGLQEYARQLKLAMEARAIGPQTAAELLKQRAGEVLSRASVGESNTQWHLGQVNVRAMAFRPPGMEEAKLADMLKVLMSIDTKMGNVVDREMLN